MDPEHYKNTARLQKDHWWYEARRIIFTDVINRLPLAEKAQTLEAGCGPGANLGMLQQFGEVSGFDPDEFAAKHASEVSNLSVKQGDLPDNCPFSGPFDLIGAFDVIEHIDDDIGAVKALESITASGGHAVFSVPAYQWMWSHHDDINHHKRRYTVGRFRDVLEQAGYEVKKISYMNMWLFPMAVLVRSLKKLLGRDEDSDVKMPSPFMNTLLTHIFASERFFLRFMPLPFGLSIIAVCEKKGGS